MRLTVCRTCVACVACVRMREYLFLLREQSRCEQPSSSIVAPKVEGLIGHRSSSSHRRRPRLQPLARWEAVRPQVR
jgi:hypothetical protein